jgi:hypothetical protein
VVGIDAGLLHFQFVRAALGVGIEKRLRHEILATATGSPRPEAVPGNLKVLENRTSGLICFPLSFVSVVRRLWRDAEIAP